MNATVEVVEEVFEAITISGIAIQETCTLDLKSDFDPTCNGSWCELLKDIVAMANSGGGKIIVGLNDDGTASGIDPKKILNIDPADFVNKVYSFTGIHFPGVATAPETHAGTSVAVLVISESSIPLVFNKAGNYQKGGDRPRCAFNPGTLYIRHGAKSEPATSDDLRDIIERHVKRDRASLLVNLRQVVEAPSGSFVSVSSVPTSTSNLDARPVRIVQDPSAAPATLLDPNLTHPYRQKEVVTKLSEHFQSRLRITPHDILAIRRLHKAEENRSFCYRPKFNSWQYSDAFIQWIINQIESDDQFLNNARNRYHAIEAEKSAQRIAAKYLN